MSAIAYQFPDAFQRGREAAITYYARVDAGEVIEGEDIPAHPYPEPETHRPPGEWHAFNHGRNT